MQRFKMNQNETRQEEEAFEFQPLDLSSIMKTKITKKVWKTCWECGKPECGYGYFVEVEEDA